MEIMVARDLAKFKLIVSFNNRGKVSLCAKTGGCSCFLLTKEATLHSLLKLVNLHIFLAELMLVLGLFVLQLYNLLVKLVPVTLHLVLFFLGSF